ncbi:MAG: peptidoglycan bridge formation glycyltransferase FemA/FemB family protein [Prevotellaceae bacterium]|nr:peptidoglycan bridge formation glycyltransferase FemA/FemB family protein [Prevotellaceae bacterium]
MITIHTEISEINAAQWAELVENSAVVSFFQTRECYAFYCSLSFLEPFVFAVSENEKLVGLICGYIIADGGAIKRFFSRRAIVPGGALLDENISDHALQSLLNTTAKILKNKVIYTELRNYNDYSKYKNTFRKAKFDYQTHLNFHLKIEKNVEQKFSESKIRQIHTAQRNGVTYCNTTDKYEIEAFYSILEKLYNRLRLPLFPLEFFLKLAELPHGKIFVVKHADTVTGGMACVTLCKKVIYEWFVCGSKISDKQQYTSVMATYAGIDFAAKNGYELFDFMGAGRPEKDYGVREFKSKFGGNLVEFGRFLLICNKFLYKIGKFYIEKL